MTSPRSFNMTKSYNAFDIPENLDATRSFGGGGAAHQTRSVGRVNIPGLGMRDLTHLDPRDVRMPNEPPRSAFGGRGHGGGRSVAFADKDRDLFEDDDDDDVHIDGDVKMDDLSPCTAEHEISTLADIDSRHGDSANAAGGGGTRRTSTFISNRATYEDSIHTLGSSIKDHEDASPTDSDTHFNSTIYVNTLSKGNGGGGPRSSLDSPQGSDEKDDLYSGVAK